MLARRRRVDNVESVEGESERVGLVEFERVMRLRVDVDAHDFEPGARISDCRAAGTAKQVE